LSFSRFRVKFEAKAVPSLEKKKVIVLGSTGSIGKSALEVVRALAPSLDVVALACRSSVVELLRQIREFSPQAVAVTGSPRSGEEEAIDNLGELRVYRGEQGLLQMLGDTVADVVVNGISGAKGLLPSLKILKQGSDLALANKETVVMAGALLSDLARESGSKLLPVDSEHHGLFCLLQERDPGVVEELILTASGGAFRDLSLKQLHHVRPEDALKHPNWEMGAKITVDSATMANKGLEVIEAHHLFGFPITAIKVLIHPQSFVHSLVRTSDGFLYAQMSQPDMRLPIQNALTYPELRSSSLESFDLAGKSLSFQAVDPDKYRLLPLAYSAAGQAAGYPIAYNAANEAAVDLFLRGQLPFLGIAESVEQVLQHDWSFPVNAVDDILEVDREARIKLKEVTTKLEDSLT
jgi:1-deoxy-D-xylulose-5-phosphate reductoisomerase